MKFSVPVAALRRAVELASHASVSSSMTPILENILLDAQFKRLLVVGNNLEMAVECSIEEDVEIGKEGTYTISSKFLTQYLSLVSEEMISVEVVSGGMLKLKTTASETKYKGIDASKFPVVPVCKGTKPLRLKGADVKKALERTIFSTASAAIRPTLAGVHIKVSEDSIVFASTDSFRLSEHICRTAGGEKSAFTVPTKTAQELLRLVSEEESVEILVDASQALFTIGDTKLFSGLLSNNFPDYSSFFPKKYNTRATLMRSELETAVKRMNLISKENNFTTRFHFRTQTGLQVTTGDTEIGAAEGTIAVSIEGADATIGLNATYLLEVLRVIKTEHVSIEFESALSPIAVKGVPSEDAKESYRHIIMPLKV